MSSLSAFPQKKSRGVMARESRSCHNVVSRSRNPAFPVEIFDHILQYLCDEAATSTDPLESRKAFIALKASSIVCKHFRQRVSPRIFRRIRVWFFNNRIFRLASVLQNNPALALYVEELVAPVSSLERIPTKIVETLLHLPSLRSLTLNSTSFADRDLSFQRQLIERYLSSEKLTYLGLTEKSHVPLSTILSCPHLETLRLDDFDFDNLELSEPSSTIKHLYIGEGTYCNSFPLSFLSYFPSLITLEIDEDFNAERPSLSFSYEPAQDVGPPSFNLEKLHLNPGSVYNIYPVLDFYLDHAEKRGVKAFQSLKALDVVATGSDLDHIMALLDDKPALRFLRINAASRTDDYFEFEEFDLCEQLAPSFGTLTELSLSFPPFYYDAEMYQLLIDLFNSLFRSMTSTNVLEVLNLDVQLKFGNNFERPSAMLWSGVANKLAYKAGFPFFKSISLEIKFVLDTYDPDDEGEQRAKIEAFEDEDFGIFNEELEIAFQPLDARRDIKLEWSTSACTSFDLASAIVKEVR